VIDDAVLDILKWALLALLYLFFARVLWAVWSEVRTPKAAPHGQAQSSPAAHPGPPMIAQPTDPTLAAGPTGAAMAHNATAPGGYAGAPGAVAAHTGSILRPGSGAAAAGDPSTSRRSAPPSKRVVKGRKGNVGRVVVTEPRARKGQAWPVQHEVTIGRAPTCTVAMPDDSFVSTLHARIYRDGPTVWVEDLGSTNGSFLNGRRLEVQ
jgi:hypothetical protein